MSGRFEKSRARQAPTTKATALTMAMTRRFISRNFSPADPRVLRLIADGAARNDDPGGL